MKDELLAIFEQQLRFASTDPISERQAVPSDAPVVVRHVPLDPHARWGWVIWSKLTEANADQVIQEQIDFFTQLDKNFEWKRYGYDGPADLDDRLLQHGFVREEVESVMVLDLAEAHSSTAPAQAQASEGQVEVRRITDSADLDKVAQIEEAVWNEPHGWIAGELRYELMLPDEPMLMYIAYADGVPAAAAWIRFYKGTDFAGLFGGSTLPAYRKRGLYTALLAVRAQEARGRGYRFLTVDASAMSRPILEQHGFVRITTATAFKYRVIEAAD